MRGHSGGSLTKGDLGMGHQLSNVSIDPICKCWKNIWNLFGLPYLEPYSNSHSVDGAPSVLRRSAETSIAVAV